MVGLNLITGLASLGLAFAQSTPTDPESVLGPVRPLSVDSGRYIVRFSDGGSARFRKRDGSLDVESFFTTLQDSAPDIEPVTTFDSDLFHGVSFDLRNDTAELVSELAALPEVESIWPAGIFTIPETTQSATVPKFPTWSPHNDTNVAEAHARGHRGDGIKVAVVDSGIDYMHPALGGGFGAGFKVEKGHDFVGDGYEPGDEYAPDDDPRDCNGHGTHVAGIVASESEIVPGVAPDARLWAYKVFGCGTSTYEDVIIAAFLRAHEDGADIITASLGSDRGFPDGPLAVVAAAIQAAGTFVSIAAGNSGEMGPFYSSSGGNVLDGTTVGSVQHDELAGYVTIATSSSGETREIAYISESQIQWDVNGTLPAVFAPDFNPCSFSGAPSVRNAVLVHPRGTCVWQIHDSAIAGSVDFVFYHGIEGAGYEIPDRVYYDPARQPKGFGYILYEDGVWLQSQYEQGHEVSFDFINDDHPVGITLESYAIGRINTFSSWGPTLDARMKPDISAPGGSIFSTWPVELGTWAVQSGTSMATPYIAGVAALFFGAQGGRGVIGSQAAEVARKRIIASGKPIHHYDGSDNLAHVSVAQQGAGLVDALKVLESTLDITPAIINLNDTANFKSEHVITIINEGEETTTYQISHDAGITVHTRPRADAWIGFDPPYSTGEGNVAVVEFSETELILQAGESITFTATFTEPANLDAGMLPVYGGGIVVASDRGDVSRIPYMGIKGSLYAADIWEMERGVPLMMNSAGGLVEEGQNFTFEDDVVPMGYFNVLFSTREVSFDFVDRDWNESDWSYPAVPGKNKVRGSVLTTPQGLSGSIIPFPIQNYPRDSGGVYARPQNVFAHGEDIPAGEYRLLGRALRTFGDPNDINDWQWKVSPWFRVTREKPPQPSTTPGPSASPTSTVPTIVPTRPCTRPIDVKVRVGAGEELHSLYRYSDFLGVDLEGSQSSLDLELNDDGHIVTPNPSNVEADLFFSVHSNSNSLVYIYQGSRVTGAFSYLDCSIVCGNRLKCVSNDKTQLYVCDNSSGLVRSGPVVVDGCQKLHLFVEELECGAAPALPTVKPL